jgi:hypothetical protein
MNKTFEVFDWDKVDYGFQKVRVRTFDSIFIKELKGHVELKEKGISPAFDLYKVYSVSGNNLGKLNFRLNSREKFFYQT